MYYDRLKTPNGQVVPVKVRSMVGIIPALAAAVIGENDISRSLTVGKRFAGFLDRHSLRDRDKLTEIGLLRGEPGQQRLLLSLCGVDRLQKLFAKAFDESEFLSPYGLRALSAYHREHPYRLEVDGITASIDYEPAESTTPMFGGNSNWRGPIWFPLNYLMISAPGAVSPVLRRRLHNRVPHRFRPAAAPGPGRRRPPGPAHLHLHPRPGR
jgi:hypothetical protein